MIKFEVSGLLTNLSVHKEAKLPEDILTAYNEFAGRHGLTGPKPIIQFNPPTGWNDARKDVSVTITTVFGWTHSIQELATDVKDVLARRLPGCRVTCFVLYANVYATNDTFRDEAPEEIIREL